jgi:ligand-binding SRPBCC domain-containing protein
MAIYTLSTVQKFPASIEDIWDFISSPQNLKDITPEHMGFDIISKDLPEKIYAGMIIQYNVKPLLGIKMNWVTEIAHVKEGEYFIDEQRFGPYKFWHHTHKITTIEGGVEMVDTVHYSPPFGIIGAMANKLIIQRQLKSIFDYRRVKLEQKFGIL